MAVLAMDGFDYDNTLQTSRYSHTASTPTISSVQAKTGSNSLLLNSASDIVRFDIGAQDGNVILIGFHLYITGLPIANTDFVTLLNSAAGIQHRIRIDTSGNIVLFGNSALGTSSTQLSINTWHHIELRIKIANSISAGEGELKIDGVSEIDLAATTDTQVQATDSFMFVQFKGQTILTAYVDNVNIRDTTGSHSTGFLGPNTAIETIRPDGNGNYNGFLGSDANSTDNYLHVDEVAADDDSSYTEASVANDKDSYTFSNLTESIASVQAIQTHTRAKKDGGTESRTMKNFLRISSTDYEGASTENLADGTYGNFVDIFDDNPNAAAQWDQTGVDGVEAGVKIEA